MSEEKKYLVPESLLNKLLAVLGELPAKSVLNEINQILAIVKLEQEKKDS